VKVARDAAFGKRQARQAGSGDATAAVLVSDDERTAFDLF